MLPQVSLSELSELSNTVQEQKIDSLFSAARGLNGEATSYIEKQILKYEVRYQMESAEMLRRLGDGKQEETSDISDWLFWLETLMDHAK